MRSSAPEGQHAPRAKQAPPSGSSGATAGPAGATPTSPRPQTSASVTHKSSTQGPLRGATSALSSQNRVSSHPRNVSGHPQLQRTQQRTTATLSQAQTQLSQQQQQRSPPNSSTGNSHSGTSIKSPTPLPKGIQSRVSQSHQPKTSSPQALPKSQSSFSAQPSSSPSQGIKNPASSFKQGSPTAKSVQPSSNPPNFGEYDDQEWDVNVGHLIIDLDADIAQADRGRMSGAPLPPSSSGTHSHQGNAPGVPVSEDKHSLKMKIKRTKPPTKTSEAKHEIVKPDVMPASTGIVMMQGSPTVSQHNGAAVKVESSSGSGSSNSNSSSVQRNSATTPRVIYKKEKRRIDVNGTTSSPPPPGGAIPARSIPHASTVTLSHISASSTHNATISSHPSVLPIPSATSQGITTSTATPPTAAAGIHHIKTEAPSASTSASGVRVLQSALHQQQQQQQQQANNNITSNNTSSQTHSDVPASQSSSHGDAPSPASKRQKLGDEETKKDACVGTSVGTITEPDCLGPCEPGSSVTLEGIVWHETEGGVLVVNVTWRGKTYVGTLLDCTKHDWAPPRFCDSPTSDLESRTPKGRAKRGRAAAAAASATTTTTAATAATTTATTSSSSSSNTAGVNLTATELNITETRSGKLRHATVKGRRGNSSVGFNPPPSPVKVEQVGTKRKGRDGEMASLQDLKSAKRVRAGSRGLPTNGCSSPTTEQQSPALQKQQPQQQEQEQEQSSNNNGYELSQAPGSPQLIECPEPNCSKKYKHINGLKYHQSHAHSNGTNEDDSGSGESKGEGSETEDKSTSLPSPKPLASTLGESTQELVKPAALRPGTVVTNGESDKLATVTPTVITQQNGQSGQQTTKSSQLYIYPNNLSSNSQQKQGTPVSARPPAPLGTSQPSGQPVNQLINTIPTQEMAVTEQAQKQDASASRVPQPQLEQSTSQSSSVLLTQNQISSTHPVILSQPKSSIQQTQPHPSPQSSHSQSIQQSTQYTTPQVQQSTSTPVQHHPLQPLACHNLPPQVPSSQHMVYSSQQQPTSVHALQQKQVSGQQSLSQPGISQSQPQHQQQGSTQQLKQSLMSQQPQQNLKLSSQPSQQICASSAPTHPPIGFQPQALEQSASSHPSQQVIQSPSRVEMKPEIINRINSVQGSPQMLSTNRPPPLITLSDSSLTSSPVVSAPASIPQGTQLSSLPGSTVTSLKIKQGLENEKLMKPKDMVNGLPAKKEDQEEELQGREDARSPAYSDISDANDSAPVIDEDGDTKDFKNNKKAEIPIGGAPPYAFGLYFGGYAQPPHPYLMPPLQHPQNMPLKPGEIKDLKDKPQDKDKKEYPPVPGTSDYLKFSQQYMYSYSHIYPPGYPDPYLRDPLYKDMMEKPKSEQEENPLMDDERGPTDLSRNSSNLEKSINAKDIKTGPDQVDGNRMHPLSSDKRGTDPSLVYRYMNPYDARIPIVASAGDKPTDVKPATPVPLSSPRLGATPPVSANMVKEEKNDRRQEVKCEGVKPTMETTGPPPPPTSSAYYPPFPYSHVPFDPYRPPIVPGISLAPGFSPYLAAPPPPGLGGLRYQLGVPNGPEDLSPSGAGGAPMLNPGIYTGSHKIAELQERMKSPSSQVIISSTGLTMSRGGSPLSLLTGNPMSASPHNLSSHLVSSPSFSTASTIFTSSMGAHQGSLMSSGHLGDRKTPPVGSRLPPHPSLTEGYPYPLLPAQFAPHFTALGVNPTVMPQVGVGGPGMPPSGMAGGAPQPK